MQHVPPLSDQPALTREQLPQQKLKLLVLGAAGAGKTSLLRRYFYRQFEYERMPTLGSDFYVGRVPFQNSPHPDIITTTVALPNGKETQSQTVSSSSFDSASTSTYINVQMWDTPGKENFALQRQRHVQYSASLSDSFFQHADAIMLVYDMTSSTSFTRLLKWYGDLMELFTKTQKTLPILIVANKLDLYQTNTTGRKNDDVPQRPFVTQRDVLGLYGITYYGKNFQYEYQICPPDDNKTGGSTHNNNNDHNSVSSSNLGGNLLPKQSNPTGNHRRRNNNKRRMEISSYLVNRDNWTTDGSYLESLLQSEDGSHPDRDMVLLWCLRNRLQMVEISAATGEGVNAAVEALTVLALEKKKVDELTTPQHTITEQYSNLGKYSNKELDLHHRFSRKRNTCFFFPSFLSFCNR
jgi:small GTP-binding protein